MLFGQFHWIFSSEELFTSVRPHYVPVSGAFSELSIPTEFRTKVASENSSTVIVQLTQK